MYKQILAGQLAARKTAFKFHSLKIITAVLFLSTAFIHSTGQVTENANELLLAKMQRNSINETGKRLLVEEVFPKAMRKFYTIFPKATHPLWVKEHHVLFVRFLNNDSPAFAAFSFNGEMNYAISSIAVSKIPETIAGTVKNRYPLYSIINAREIITNDDTLYELVLQNTNGYIVVQANDNEIIETKRLRVNKDSPLTPLLQQAQDGGT